MHPEKRNSIDRTVEKKVAQINSLSEGAKAVVLSALQSHKEMVDSKARVEEVNKPGYRDGEQKDIVHTRQWLLARAIANALLGAGFNAAQIERRADHRDHGLVKILRNRIGIDDHTYREEIEEIIQRLRPIS